MFKQSSDQIQVSSRREPGRNPENHLRVIGIRVELKLGVEATKLEYLDRIFKQFREFFTVPSNVSLGIPALVTVIGAAHQHYIHQSDESPPPKECTPV